MRILPLLLDAGKRSFSSIKTDPHFFLLLLSQLSKGRLMIPIDALNWLFQQVFQHHPMLKKLSLKAADSREGLFLTAEVEVMGERIQVQGLCKPSKIQLTPKQILATIELSNIETHTQENSSFAEMFKMLDLQKPGDLLSWLPEKPAFLLSGSGNQISFDLAQLPIFQKNSFGKKVLAVIAKWVPMVSIQIGKKAIIVQSMRKRKALSKKYKPFSDPATYL